MLNKRYFFILFITMFLLTTSANAQGTSVSGSSAVLVYNNGSSSTCRSDFCDYQISGTSDGVTFTKSVSYMNLYFTNNIPKDKKVILSYSESVYPGSNFLVSGFNSTNLDISNVAVAVSSENGYLIYSYTIIGTMLNTQNYITLTHNISPINSNVNSWYKIRLSNLTYYDVSDSESLLADILAQQNTWATQQNTYLGYITSNTDNILSVLQNQSSGIIESINSTTDSVNNVNDSINDSSIDNTNVDSSTDGWSSANAQNGVINQLILMPINFIQSFINGMGNSCSSYNFGNFLGTDLVFPCINLSNILGPIYTIIDLLISGVFIYKFGTHCVKIFNDLTNLRDNQINDLYGGGSL